MKYLKNLVFIIPVILGVFNTDLSVAGKAYKGVYYDNFKYTDNVEFNGYDGINIDYNAKLRHVGDYYEIVFDVINDSSVDVEISNCIYNVNDPYIEYELLYDDGKKIHKGDILKKGESKKVKYHVLYKNPILDDSYQFDSSFSIGYEQKM